MLKLIQFRFIRFILKERALAQDLMDPFHYALAFECWSAIDFHNFHNLKCLLKIVGHFGKVNRNYYQLESLLHFKVFSVQTLNLLFSQLAMVSDGVQGLFKI